MQKVVATWKAPKQYEAKTGADTVVPLGKGGQRPTDLLLAALAGCAALTFEEKLAAQGVSFLNLSVEVEGERQTEPPTRFIKYRVHFDLTGENTRLDKVLNALDETETHCAVINSLKGNGEIELGLTVNGAKILPEDDGCG